MKNIKTAEKKIEKFFSSDNITPKIYGFMEFNSNVDKIKALENDFRVFGLKIGNKICKLDDADYKLSLSCNNIPWGTSMDEFIEFLNKIFRNKDLTSFKNL